MRDIFTVLLPILSGFFIGTSYIPFPPWASLFCFVPLWLFWLKQDNLKQVVLGGWITAFVFSLIGFNWIAHTLHEFAHLNWFFSVIGLLVFAAIAHLYVPLAGLLWFVLKTRLQLSASPALMLMVLITTLCEAYSLTLFDWNFGYSWYGAGIPIYQLAEWIGFSGLSALTLLFNLPFLLAWKQRKSPNGKYIVAATLAVLLCLNATGLWLKARLQAPDASFSTLLVQGNIGNEEKLAAELGQGFRDNIIKRYWRLTTAAVHEYGSKEIDFIVWPEAAFPSLLGANVQSRRHPQFLKQAVQQWQVPLITGAFSADMQTRLIGNSLFSIDAQGEIVPPFYTKSILLAFGEYIPGEQWFPQIRQWLPPIGQFQRGPGPSMLLSVQDFQIAPQICYESLFPVFSRDMANLGAQFIVNVTNDSWYGQWQEPYQHMYMTLARGVEFRRPVVRATNTGISTVSLANGEILARSPLHEQWSGLYQVPYLKQPPVTFYQCWIYLGPGLLWAGLGVLLCWGWRQKKLQDIGKKQ